MMVGGSGRAAVFGPAAAAATALAGLRTVAPAGVTSVASLLTWFFLPHGTGTQNLSGTFPESADF
jgi:hypothetical protein